MQRRRAVALSESQKKTVYNCDIRNRDNINETNFLRGTRIRPVIIAMGDFNARTRPREGREQTVLNLFCCLGKRQRNEEKLLQLTYENNY